MVAVTKEEFQELDLTVKNIKRRLVTIETQIDNTDLLLPAEERLQSSIKQFREDIDAKIAELDVRAEERFNKIMAKLEGKNK